MLDVRKPLGLLFLILGSLLFLYGQFFSEPVTFYTPHTSFPLKLNQPVGLFMFAFGLIMWFLSRYVELSTLDRELGKREKELERVERKRAKALAKQQAAAEAAGLSTPVDLSDSQAAKQSIAQENEAIEGIDDLDDDDDELDDDAVDDVPDGDAEDVESDGETKEGDTSGGGTEKGAGDNKESDGV